MIRSRIPIFAASFLSILIGVFNIFLYFYDVIPGQIPTGAPFYLRTGVVFILGIPMLIQFLSRLSPDQRPKAVSVLSLIVVLAISIILMMLLLPSMTKTIGSWGE